jgi:hypothetical protein
MFERIPEMKALLSAQIAQETAHYLAQGGRITPCEPCKETWQLYAVDVGGDEIALRRVKVLPDLKAMKAAKVDAALAKALEERTRREERRAPVEGNPAMYLSAKMCKRGHTGMRYTRNDYCVQCARDATLAHYYEQQRQAGKGNIGI